MQPTSNRPVETKPPQNIGVPDRPPSVEQLPVQVTAPSPGQTTRNLQTRTADRQGNWFSKAWKWITTLFERAPAQAEPIERPSTAPVEKKGEINTTPERALNTLALCIDKLKQSVKSEGLLRVAGNTTVINPIAENVNNPDVALGVIKAQLESASENEAGDIFKRTIGSMQKAAYEEGNAPSAEEWAAAWDYSSKDLQKEAVKALVERLPKENQQMLSQVLQLCYEIKQQSDTNRMDTHNLAIVLVSRLFYTPDPLEAERLLTELIAVAEILIDSYEPIDDIEFDVKDAADQQEIKDIEFEVEDAAYQQEIENIEVDVESPDIEPAAQPDDAAFLQDIRSLISDLSTRQRSELRDLVRFHKNIVDSDEDKEAATLRGATKIAERFTNRDESDAAKAQEIHEQKIYGARLMIEHFDELFPE